MFEIHGIVDLNASDHNLIFATRKQPKLEKMDKHIWCWSFCKFESVLFEQDVIFYDWTDVMQSTDSNRAWDLFVEKVNTLLDVHAPFKNIRIPESVAKWVTQEYMAQAFVSNGQFH